MKTPRKTMTSKEQCVRQGQGRAPVLAEFTFLLSFCEVNQLLAVHELCIRVCVLGRKINITIFVLAMKMVMRCPLNLCQDCLEAILVWCPLFLSGRIGFEALQIFVVHVIWKETARTERASLHAIQILNIWGSDLRTVCSQMNGSIPCPVRAYLKPGRLKMQSSIPMIAGKLVVRRNCSMLPKSSCPGPLINDDNTKIQTGYNITKHNKTIFHNKIGGNIKITKQSPYKVQNPSRSGIIFYKLPSRSARMGIGHHESYWCILMHLLYNLVVRWCLWVWTGSGK